jgi:hypothetical protein
MKWSDVSTITARVPLPDGYRYEALTRAGIRAVVEAVRDWYPSIAVGNASGHLDERFYADKVAFEDAPDRDFLVVLIKKGGELAAVLSVERDPGSQVLYGRIGVVSPKHRGVSLGDHFPALAEAIGRDMGMGMVYGLATLKVPHMQAKFERLGFQLIGIIPGFDREMVEPGVVKRVYEAIYAKVLVDDADFLTPSHADMTARTSELFALLYPGKAAV